MVRQSVFVIRIVRKVDVRRAGCAGHEFGRLHRDLPCDDAGGEQGGGLGFPLYEAGELGLDLGSLGFQKLRHALVQFRREDTVDAEEKVLRLKLGFQLAFFRAVDCVDAVVVVADGHTRLNVTQTVRAVSAFEQKIGVKNCDKWLFLRSRIVSR